MTLAPIYQSHRGVEILNTLLSGKVSFDRLLYVSEP